MKHLRKFNEDNKYDRSVAMIHDYLVDNLAYLIDLSFNIHVNYNEISISLGKRDNDTGNNRYSNLYKDFYWDDIKYDIIPVIEQLYKEGNIKNEIILYNYNSRNPYYTIYVDEIIKDKISNKLINKLIIPLIK